MDSSNAFLLTTLNVSEFRKFKKALRTLQVVGLDHAAASDLILEGIRKLRDTRDRLQVERRVRESQRRYGYDAA